MKVIIYGAGYVGCVTGACVAKMGHSVVIVDAIQSKVDCLRAGRSPIVEPDLEDLIAEGVAGGRLKAEMAEIRDQKSDLRPLISDLRPPTSDPLIEADLAMVCIGTPSQRDGRIDTRALSAFSSSIAGGAERRASPLTVVVRSTALAPLLRQVLAETQPRQGVDKLRLVMNPEFLRETTAISDFFNPPFLVAGGDDPAAVDHALSLFAGIHAPALPGESRDRLDAQV